MAESGSLQSVVDAAEEAAGAGDFAAAAQHLQQAVRLQEIDLGPKHPDLANTLNNLGVVCERIGDWPEAERSYRRAAAIAAAALPAEHPFVATSRQNLSDFCAMRGLPFADSASPPSAPATAPRTVPPLAAEPARSSARGLAIAAILVIGAGVAFFAWSKSLGDSRPSSTPSATAENKATPTASPPAAAPPAATTQPSASAATPVVAPPKPGPAAPANNDTKPAAGSAGIALVSAELCRTLGTGGGEWKCTPAGAEVSAGPLYFYTRLKSPADVIVRHRWYRGDQLRQAGDLKVTANTSAGYRTYSRHTVSGGPADWRVELSTVDGRLLHEERFVVR